MTYLFPSAGVPRTQRRICVLAAYLATCLALPVHATTSFPTYPLQTGVGSIPPNILFILDDSGSMAWDFMPGAVSGDSTTLNNVTSPSRIGLKTYVHNTLQYNPNITYNAWKKADGTRFTDGVTMTSVYTHDTLRSSLGDISRDVNDFYVPKSGVTDFANSANFDRYVVTTVAGTLGVWSGYAQNTLLNDNQRDLNANSSQDFTVSVAAGSTKLHVWTEGGSRDANLFVYRGTTLVCSSTNTGNNEDCLIDSPTTGNYTVRITGQSNGVRNINTHAETFAGTLATPTGRSQADELTNYATWYSYHRTRSKVAKAGASEAFEALSDKFRVGYDSIWNRNGATAVGTGQPAYPIPVGTEDGAFKDSNKSTWFTYLQSAVGSSGTPLHGALKRAGDYFETQTGSAGPWGPQVDANSQLSCRQSYAILTTDGYWNDSNGGFGNAPGTAVVGNADGTAGTQIASANGSKTYTYAPARPYSDSAGDTLADVAMYYWKRDLRTDLANNVPSSTQNEAFWQHMSTFGISIGLQGTVSPGAGVTAIKEGTSSWPNPWRTNSNNNDRWDNESNRRIDDLLHAAVNGRGSFVAASNPQQFATALQNTLTAIQAQKASGSNVASNGPSLNNGSLLFQAVYMSGEWSGDVLGQSLVGGSIGTPATWSMKNEATKTSAAISAFASRNVFTYNGTGGTSFPTAAQTTALARTTGGAQVTGANNAAYIKGTRTLEVANGGTLRNRASPIGDIVNSSPFYVPASDTLFIGANDGMLHAVDASGTDAGKTLFSYVPSGLKMADLASLSDPNYDHRFFVDGAMDVTTLAQGKNKNLLVAGLGRGGKGVFGLDVTAPTSFSASNVLWDRTYNDDAATVADADMGYVTGAPLIRQGNNGKTLVIFGNGIDSVNGSSVVFVYVLNDDGTLSQTLKFDSRATGSNGMAEPRAADTNADGKVDYVYAGDLRGNLWKLDLTNVSTGAWGFAYGTASAPLPMFVAKDAANNLQPITAAVALATEPMTNRLFVLFGTGKYIADGDVNSTSVQTIYGLIDDNARITARSDLQTRTIAFTGTDSLGRAARSWESYAPLSDGKRGWYVDLGIPKPGERVVTAPFVRQRALWFSSIMPSAGTGCDSGGTGYLNAVDAFTGTNPQRGGHSYSYIDVNGDGVGNDKLTGGSSSTETHYVTSVDLGIGMPAQGTGVGNNVYACGSEAECGRIQTPPGGGDPKRLNWREIFNRD